MKDHYKTLGVDKSASKDDIKKAFRKLAHEHHPDKTKNDPTSSQKFKEASEAYSVLSDDAKRKQYDTYGSAGPGFNPGAAGGFGGGFGGFDFSQFTQNGQNFEFDIGDLFGEFFGGGGRRPRRGKNITVDVQISFKDSVFGIDRDITVDKQKFSVHIPAGIESGQGLRIGGRGEKGDAGPGDLIVRIWVDADKRFRKEGQNIITRLDIKLSQALLGGNVSLETVDGPVELKIPSGINHEEILRVKGKGVASERGKRGDLLVVISVVMPRKLSRSQEKIIQELKNEGL